MSRVIVKNLPKKITEKKVRDLFGEFGTVTDCSLKYNAEGTFRRFAFIGFVCDEQASGALEALNNTYLNTSRIQVQLAKDLTESAKRTSTSSGSKSKDPAKSPTKKKEKAVAEEIIGELDEDEGFQEFLHIHKSGDKTSWRNDDDMANSKLEQNNKQTKGGLSKDENQKNLAYAFEGESDSSEDDEPVPAPASANKEEEKEEMETKENLVAKDKTLTDMDYLRKKSGAVSHLSDDEDEAPSPKKEPAPETKTKKKKKKKDKEPKNKEEFIVKLKNIPPNSNRTLIQSFLQGITIKGLDIPRNAAKKIVGVAFIHLRSQIDVDAALRRSRNMMGKKKISVTQVMDKNADADSAKKADAKSISRVRPWELKASMEEVEPIADSGRIFVRNLPHICNEEDLEKLFGDFGNLTEVNLPIDRMSKQIKGYAHITFMFPEHAVKAFNKLDGTTYKGRLLHILPGKPAKQHTETDGDSTDFRKKKQDDQKKNAQNSHNWNSLFLGADAVANAMAGKYGIDKSQLLDVESGQSLGVRLALGETEVVNETRDFLIDNGVALDSFSQAAGPRSKTVLLVKNLPSKTSIGELNDTFKPFGLLGRVLLPPSGISALIEFQEPFEAKAAFMKLAYSKFKHLPLYLEWAPVGVFGKSEPKATEEEQESEETDEIKTENLDDISEDTAKEEASTAEKTDTDDKAVKNEPSTSKSAADQSEDSSDDEDTPTEGCTLFVKNLKFSTDDEQLKQHFCGCGKVVTATVARKRDAKNPGKALSMGYGFVQFKKPSSAQEALKELQHSTLDGHNLELKMSERTTSRPTGTTKKNSNTQKTQKSTKMLVRNIPFQANHKEITELFKVFGELKLVRLPKKVGGQHRGFAFVDYITKNDAKRAFNALCHSTHLYGRRLVLEWADTSEESVDNLRRKTASGYEGGQARKVFKRTVFESTLEDLEAKKQQDE